MRIIFVLLFSLAVLCGCSHMQVMQYEQHFLIRRFEHKSPAYYCEFAQVCDFITNMKPERKDTLWYISPENLRDSNLPQIIMDWEPSSIWFGDTGLSMILTGSSSSDACWIAWNTNMDQTAQWTLSVHVDGKDTVVFKKAK